MTKKTRAPRRRAPTFTPLQIAMFTGGPLPDDVGPFEALPFSASYLNDISPAGVRAQWRTYHDRDMTDDEVAAVVARGPELKAAVDRTRTRRNTAAPGSTAPTNWPDQATAGFTPIATTTGEPSDDHND